MKSLSFSVALVALAAVGCAPTLPNELRSARVAYERAATSSNAKLVPREVGDAKAWLNRAESEYSDTGNSEWARDIAYIAHRKALAAEADGEAARSEIDRQTAIAQAEQLQAQRVSLAMDVMKRPTTTVKDALAKINDVKTKDTDRGLVVTVPGSVVFASGQANVVGAAKDELSQIALALKDDGRRIVIVGHTDDRGSEGENQRLSERRAVAVKDLFVKQGIPENKLDARGVGAGQPLVANDDEKGRATNRRIEIRLED